MAKKKCIAIHRGYDGVSLIEPGQVFHYDGAPAPWFKPHGLQEEEQEDQGDVEPEALKGPKGGKGSKEPKPSKGSKDPVEPEAPKLPASSGDESVI